MEDHRKDSFAGHPGLAANLAQTDPEFSAIFDHFVSEDVLPTTKLDERTRYLTILASLVGCQGRELFIVLLPVAMEAGLTQAEIKEMLYQATAYLGIGRVLPFLKATNEDLEQEGETLEKSARATVTSATRREKGTAAQVAIFGDQMEDFWRSGPEESRHINLWLAENCFGDYYTREGLDMRERELITFCFLAAQGGCDPQLTSHAAGNMRMGNDKAYLIDVISQCLPYIGYPRSLNALACVNKAAENAG